MVVLLLSCGGSQQLRCTSMFRQPSGLFPSATKLSGHAQSPGTHSRKGHCWSCRNPLQPNIVALCCPAAPAAPSGSYTAFEVSTECGSELQKSQAQCTRESTEAWKGMQAQGALHDIPEDVSAGGFKRIQAMLARSGRARHAPPAGASQVTASSFTEV